MYCRVITRQSRFLKCRRVKALHPLIRAFTPFTVGQRVYYVAQNRSQFSPSNLVLEIDRQITRNFTKLFTNCAALTAHADKNRRLVGTIGENIFSQCGSALRPQYAIACIFICEKARDLHCSTFQRDCQAP